MISVVAETGLLGSIPAPPFDDIGFGPVNFRLYGLLIAIGVLAAVAISQRRWSRWGGDSEDIVTVAIWAVPAGLIGARLYHVLTDWGTLYDDGRWPEAFKIWQGGLGIPGGVLLGGLVGVIVAKRIVPSAGRLADAVAAGIPVAQAIGRLGNYFNQELYGGPTTLPWALNVDIEHRPLEYIEATTYHPTFLYEGLWNLGLAGLIIWGSSRWILKPGRWFAVYIMGYGLGRLWVESIRIDEATLLGGVRVNIWMSLAIILGGLAWLLWGGSPLDSVATARLRSGDSFKDILGADTAHKTAGVTTGGSGAGSSDSDSADSDSDGSDSDDPESADSDTDDSEDTDSGKADSDKTSPEEQPEDDETPTAAEDSSDEGAEPSSDSVAEDGPDVDGPVAEGSGSDDDAEETGSGVDPEETT